MRHRHVNRRGQALVEFAVVCLVVYMLLAAILTFGQILYSAQAIQQAADVAAREISRTPLPAVPTIPTVPTSNYLKYVLYDGDWHTDPTLTNLRQRVFDDNLLVLTIDATESGSGITFNGGHPIGDFPLVTQQLLPVMIYDEVGGQKLLRYPGALCQSAQQGYASPAGISASGYVVRIPVVGTSTTSGGWEYPLEAILDGNGVDGFALNAPTLSGQSGIVALRVNYPYQSATMSGFQPPANPASPPGPPDNPVVPILAGSGVSSLGSPPGAGSPVVSDFQYGPYAGADGLGQQAAWATTVRPYRSLISAQAIYRREVFQ
jgi:hypothetical protein